MRLDLKQTTEFVRHVLNEQAALSRERWSSVGSTSYKNQRDFTTEVDLEIEGNIRKQFSERFSNHGFSGEETPAEKPEAEFQWLVDPIDGTKWYAAQSSLFSISVALLYHEEPVLGVVHAPASEQCFYAYKDGGAYLDGQRLRGPNVSALSKVIAAIDTPRSHELPTNERLWFESKLLQMTRSVYRIRALGLGSLAACWLASGALDAYVDLTGYVKPQDVAAGRVIMKESGAKVQYVTAPVGPPRLLAASPQI